MELVRLEPISREWLSNREGGNPCTDLLGKVDSLLDRLAGEIRPVSRDQDILEHIDLLLSAIQVATVYCSMIWQRPSFQTASRKRSLYSRLPASKGMRPILTRAILSPTRNRVDHGGPYRAEIGSSGWIGDIRTGFLHDLSDCSATPVHVSLCWR